MAAPSSADLIKTWNDSRKLSVLVRLQHHLGGPQTFPVSVGFPEEWQHGTTLEARVFRVAATIPIQGIHLDTETFIRQLRDSTAG